MTEIEVKLRVSDADEVRRRLAAAGAEEATLRLFEDNRLYDDAAGTLAGRHQILRLRSVGGRHVLTFKTPEGEAPDDTRYKVRIEHETTLGEPEPLDRLFCALGYAPVWRYQKYRQSYRLRGVHVELDETPIGVFVELEGEREAIDGAAAALGFSAADYITMTYRQLAKEHAGTDRPADLVFPGPDPA